MNPSILDLLRRGESFLLVGHRGPDGDSLGSLVGLYRLLKALGRPATLLLEKRRPPEFDFLSDLDEAALLGQGPAPEAQILVLVDCGRLSRTGGLETLLAGRAWPKILVVDHHPGEEGALPAGETLRLVDPTAAASALLVLELYDALNRKPDPTAAEALLAGILTDTFWFQNSNADPRALAAAARLVSECAPTHGPGGLHELIFRRQPAGLLHLLGAALGRAEFHAEGRCVLTWVSRAEVAAAGVDELETDLLSRPLTALAGVELAAVLVERKPGWVKFSFRSRGSGSALALGRALGGGGHREAAGADCEGSLEQARGWLLEAWAKLG